MTLDEMLAMKLNTTKEIFPFHFQNGYSVSTSITRVPGGWKYTDFIGGMDSRALSSIFVSEKDIKINPTDSMNNL